MQDFINPIDSQVAIFRSSTLFPLTDPKNSDFFRYRFTWVLVCHRTSAGKRIPAGCRRRLARSRADVDGVASSRHWSVLRVCAKACSMVAEQGDRLCSPHSLLCTCMTAYSSALCLFRQSPEQNRESARLALKTC